MAYKKIQFKRGTKTGIPVLRSGEPGFTQDEKSLYIGDGTANQRFLNEVQVGTKIDEKIAPVTQSITNNVAALNESITNNIATVNQAITDKAKINGEATNVNFIRNDVVQNGLVSTTSIKLDLSNDFTLSFKYTSDGTRNGFICRQGSSTSDGGFGIGVSSDGRFRCGLSDTITYLYAYSKEISTLGNTYNIVFSKKNGNITFFVNGDCVNVQYANIVNIDKYVTFTNCTNQLSYNRQLTPKEITHNFNVLSNSPSINKINDYVIASDTDHITDSGSILQSKINRVFYKNMCKEFTSDGTDIVVNNGMDGYVLSGTMQGQTVKNIAYTNQDLYTVTATPIKPVKLNNAIANQTYTVCFFAQECEAATSVRISLDSGYYVTSSSTSVSNGFNSFVISQPTIQAGKDDFHIYCTSGSFKFKNLMVLEGDWTNKITSYIPFGLSSTQAVVSNLGLKYSFYMPTIDGKTRVMKATRGTQNWVEIDASEARDTATYDYKLESINGDLGGVPISCDYIDRARKVKVFNTKEIVLDGSESGWNKSSSGSALGSITTGYYLSIDGLKDVTLFDVGCICDKLSSSSQSYGVVDGYYGIWVHSSGNRIYIRVPISIATISSFKEWLRTNPITIRYPLITPIEVPMTDAELSAYDTYRKVIDLGGVGDVRNTFEIKEDGSAVYVQKTIKNTFSSNSQLSTQNDIYISFLLRTTHKALITYGQTININIAMGELLKRPWDVDDTVYNETNKVGYGIGNNGDNFFVKVPKSTFPTTESFNTYLYKNNMIIEYVLLNPIVTVIPKELVSAVLTQLQNTFTFGEGVMATKATISVPVDCIGEMQTQINEIKALITTPSNINLTMNYVEDEYNKNQSEEGVV